MKLKSVGMQNSVEQGKELPNDGRGATKSAGDFTYVDDYLAELAVDLSSVEGIIRFVNLMLWKGVAGGAREIKLTHWGSEFKISFLLGNYLKSVDAPSVRYAPAIVARIKCLANLGIEKHCAYEQNGIMKLTIAGQPVDIFVTCRKLVGGESIVLQIKRNS